MATRKDELLEELQKIQQKDLEAQVSKIGYTKTIEQKGHNFVMKGDFWIKLFMALGVLSSFVWIVYTGNDNSMHPELLDVPARGNGNFQLLSVVGPLFGMVLQYYFGKNKAGANGE